MKKKFLKDVTLICASSINIDHSIDSLLISSYEIEFACIKFLSDKFPKKRHSNIEYIKTPKLDLDKYNCFIMNDLYNYIDTSHCLIIQSDSFVVNPDIWTDEFLEFDYLGAPWTKKISPNEYTTLNLKKNRVGNGGFSLRSKKLINLTRNYNYFDLTFPVKQEDVIICYYLYEDLIKNDVKFAPISLASKFSVEHPETNKEYGINNNNVFGFHGKHLQRYFKDRFVKNRLK